MKSENAIALDVSGDCFFFCGALGQISSSMADMRTRMSSFVTFQTMKSLARLSGPS